MSSDLAAAIQARYRGRIPVWVDAESEAELQLIGSVQATIEIAREFQTDQRQLAIGETLEFTSLAQLVALQSQILERYVVPGSRSRQRSHIPAGVQVRVLERDGYCCRMCRTGGSEENPLEVDHIEPWSVSRDDSIENLMVLCRTHNRGKSARRLLLVPPAR